MTTEIIDETVQLDTLITAAPTSRHGRERRIALGNILISIREITSKTGCGSFGKTVVEKIGMLLSVFRDYVGNAGTATTDDTTRTSGKSESAQ
jgi:hypothetical protein